jgi:hypothetical protein
MRAGPWPAGRPDGPLTVILDGWRRVRGAPGVLAGAWALSVLGAPAFNYLLHVSILGQMVVGGPTITVDVPAWAAILTLFLVLVWTVLFGGIIDRYARPEGAMTQGFVAACQKYAGRMLLVGLIGGIAYTLAEIVQMKLLMPWILDVMAPPPVQEGVPQTMRQWLPWYLSALPQYAVHILIDLTRVRLVADDRRSVLSAAAAGWRLLAASPLTIIGIYLLAALAFYGWSSLLSTVTPADAGDGVGWIVRLLLTAGGALTDLLILATLVAQYQALMARGALASAEPIGAAPALVPEASASLAKE